MNRFSATFKKIYIEPVVIQEFLMGGELGGGAPNHRKPLEAWSAGRFCNFSTKMAHFYAYFGQNSCVKEITHQLKTFEKQCKPTK